MPCEAYLGCETTTTHLKTDPGPVIWTGWKNTRTCDTRMFALLATAVAGLQLQRPTGQQITWQAVSPVMTASQTEHPSDALVTKGNGQGLERWARLIEALQVNSMQEMPRVGASVSAAFAVVLIVVVVGTH